MAEMLLAIPLILLFAAGLAQFTLLFLCQNQFEHACGQAVREYATGARSSKTLSEGVWSHLESFRPFFSRDSIRINLAPSGGPSMGIAEKRAKTGRALKQIQAVGRLVQGEVFDYSNGNWDITIRYKSKPIFGLLFPDGITFRTRVAVQRHPGENP